MPQSQRIVGSGDRWEILEATDSTHYTTLTAGSLSAIMAVQEDREQV